MRECLICGGTRPDGRKEVIYDYCKICLASDIATLRYIHLKSLLENLRKIKAPCNPEKDRQGA